MDRALFGLLWTFSGVIGQSLLQVVVVMILARLLEPAAFGLIGAALVAVGFAQVFSQLGVGAAIVQRTEVTPTHVKVGFTLSMVLSLLVGVGVILSSSMIAQLFRMPLLQPVLIVLGMVFPITGLGIVSQALLQREMRFRHLALTHLVSYGFGYGVFGITLASLGYGVWALVVAQMAQSLSNSVIMVLLKRKGLGLALKRREAAHLLNLGVGFSLARIGNYFANQADNIIVGRWMGVEALGFYGRAYQFLVMPANLFGAVADSVLFPAMSSVQDDRLRLARAYILSISVVAMITLPLSSYLIVMAPEVIRVLLGPQWDEVVLPFRILAASLAFRTSYKISDSLTRATGVVYQRAWRHWFYAGAIFLGAWIGHFSGLAGVATGVSLAIVLNFLVMIQLSLRVVPASWREVCAPHLRHCAVAAMVFAVTMLYKAVPGVVQMHPLLIVAGGGCVAVVVFWLMWWSCRDLFGGERAWIESITRRYRGVAG